MFKKLKEFENKPITWGAYGKLCLWSWIAGMLISIGYALVAIDGAWEWVCDKVVALKHKLMPWKYYENKDGDFED